MRISIGDITGSKFGRLIAQWPVGIAKHSNKYWLCLCDCGNLCTARIYDLGNGVSSCGCWRAEVERMGHRLRHGHAPRSGSSAEYRSWMAMRNRCQQPKTMFYERYGGRGIRVCERWQKFENFLADMGPRPEGKTLDRYPNPDGNYEPGNCRWATPKEQRHNRTSMGHSNSTLNTAI